MDFTIEIYKGLLRALQNEEYSFQTVAEFLNSPKGNALMLRHDVDARNEHSLRFAQIQQELGIKGTYYFRMVPQSYDEPMIKSIAEMGHEIGYHYEDMDFADGNPEKAINLFEQHLAKLRHIVNVQTICMHGSPLSRYDNRNLWKFYDYRDYGIIGEPYFDIDFNKVFYLTDTGRRWDGNKVSMRDTSWNPDPSEYKVPVRTTTNNSFLEKSFHSTEEVIEAVEKGKLPEKVMMNFHPQRWTDNSLLWCYELLSQNIKNVAKRILKKVRN